jgi:hypothetical protein
MPPKRSGPFLQQPDPQQFPIAPIDIYALPTTVNIAFAPGLWAISPGRKAVSIEHFRRRADECRRLAVDAGNESDRAFWLKLVERWQALEIQKARQPVKSRSALRQQSELSAAD